MIFYRSFQTQTGNWCRCCVLLIGACLTLSACSPANVPSARNLSIPSPTMAEERRKSINERPDSVIHLPLGSDVLVPKAVASVGLPEEIIGPFELRSETVAGALQLILADYEIPMAFETDAGFTRTVTVTNLRGSLASVVRKVCGLADLYCSYEDGLLVVKETQTFTVTIPPIGGETDVLANIATGLAAITGVTPITEEATRTIIYEATNRTAELASRYFQRVRASTALIVFEVYIWEVTLNNGNATGINWESIEDFGVFNAGIQIAGSSGALNPISIGLPTRGDVSFGTSDVFEFISEYGAVKTISQPQITVLSGATASLRAADTVNYVSSLTRSTEDGETTVSTETDSVDTGFTLSISSQWDNATVYGEVDIDLDEFRGFQNFDADGTVLQLPQTTERELSTQIRIRPGDSLLIAGLVRETDELDEDGPGFDSPLIPTSRSLATSNTELVFLLKPRVIVYTEEGDDKNHKGQTTLSDAASFSPEELAIQQYPVSLVEK
ncbi:MAG: type II and III secretion system family protein [Alphaproteobacteria bacterium]|nr:type II and III secretion system family protein [Alphaproteobacteria bacterium]